MQFRLTPPQDLVSRLFMLEYLRRLGAETTYKKMKPEQRKAFFYIFTSEDGKEQVDYNWEYLLFVATVLQIEGILKNFMVEIEEFSKKDMEESARMKFEEEVGQPVSISVYDMAKAAMDNKNLMGVEAKKIILPN